MLVYPKCHVRVSSCIICIMCIFVYVDCIVYYNYMLIYVVHNHSSVYIYIAFFYYQPSSVYVYWLRYKFVHFDYI